MADFEEIVMRSSLVGHIIWRLILLSCKDLDSLLSPPSTAPPPPPIFHCIKAASDVILFSASVASQITICELF